MRRYCVLIVLLLLLICNMSAISRVIGIPISSVKTVLDIDDTYAAVRSMSALGYGVLYYNEAYLITSTPADAELFFTSTVEVETYPDSRNLYLVSKTPVPFLPQHQGSYSVILDLETSFLLSSTLNYTEIIQLLHNPVTQLDMQPMMFSTRSPIVAQMKAIRADIQQLVNLVEADSLQSAMQSLEDFQTRHALAENRWEVAEWIRQRFISFGIQDAELDPFSWEGTEQYNVVATIEGSEYADEYIIVGAHHDSRSSNLNNYAYAPGADDNASGTAAVLEIARVIMQAGFLPKTSIKFITFACEEYGLWGSKEFSTDAFNTDLNIRLMVNHDMIANNTAVENRQVKIMPYDGALDYSDLAYQLTQQYTTLIPYYGILNSGGTDSYPFWQRGYNVAFFNESEFSPVYHSDSDIVTNLDPQYCAEVLKASLAFVVTCADMEPYTETDLIWEENFDYTLSTNLTSTGWIAYSSAGTNPLKVVSASLNYPDYPSGNGHATAISGSGEDVHRRFGPVPSDSVYSSILVKITSVNTTGDYFVHLGAVPFSVTQAKGRIFVKANASGRLAFGISNAGEYASAVFTDYDYLPNETYLLILKYQFMAGANNNLVSLFVNPQIAPDEPPATIIATDQLTSEPISIGSLGIRQGHSVNAPSAVLDGIRITSSWEALMDIEMEVVPVELSSFTVLHDEDNAVNLTWITQSETDLLGFYVYRSLSQLLSEALLISPLISATNSSQQHSYNLFDESAEPGTILHYWLKCISLDGSHMFHGPVVLDYNPEDVDGIPDASIVTGLQAVYPNPFNPTLTIPYSVATSSSTDIRIYNSRGQIVRQLSPGIKQPGNYHIIWDGLDASGQSISSGLYIIRMDVDSGAYLRKVMFLK